MTSDVKTVLQSSHLLERLSDEELDHLLTIANQRSFAAGSRLVEAGSDHALGMWVILDGTVEVTRDGKLLDTLGPGDHVGEMALMSDMVRSADVTAVTDVETLQLARWDLRGLIADHPDIALSMMDSMAARLAHQNAAR